MLIEYLHARYNLCFHRVGDVYSTDRDGRLLTQAERDKWFVAADAESKFPQAALAVPLGDDLDHIQSLAIEHMCLEMEGPCDDCKAIQPAQVLGSSGLCGECAERLKRQTLDAMYETATDGWHD